MELQSQLRRLLRLVASFNPLAMYRQETCLISRLPEAFLLRQLDPQSRHPCRPPPPPQLALHYARRTVLRGVFQRLGVIVRTAHYPTLPPTSGMSTANCAYTSTPSATVNPISVTAAPANIPGEAGLPGCNYFICPDEQGYPHANYCDCGGMYAGSLTTSVSGTSNLNCDFTIQPTANDCLPPATTILSSTTPNPPPSTTPSAPHALPTTAAPKAGPNDQTTCAGSKEHSASDTFSCPNSRNPQ